MSPYADDLHEYKSLCEYFGEKPRILGDDYSYENSHAVELKKRYNAEGSKPTPGRPSAFERLTKDEDDFE